MTRRRQLSVGHLAVGLALVGVYLVAAVATMVFSDRPFRPLFDGLAPPVAYRWVNPPGENARDNQQPAAGRQTVPLGPEGSPFVNVTPVDGQAILLLEEKAVPPHPPATTIDVNVIPLDVLTLGPIPNDMTIQSNAYRVQVDYLPPGGAATSPPTGEPVTDFKLDTSAIDLVAAGASDFLLFSTDGQSWAKRDTTPLGLSHGLETKFAGAGYYVVTSIKGSAGGGASPLVVILVLLVPPLMVGGLVLRRRRAKAAAAARIKAAAAKRRGPPPKGGPKSKGRRR